MTEIHPSEQHFWFETHRNSRVAGWLCALAAWAMLITGCFTDAKTIRIPLFAIGLTMTVAARQTRRIARATQDIIQDCSDISDQSRQNRLYEAFKPSQPALLTLSAPVTQPELFDWQEFKTSPNRFPHLLIEGPTGTGKTSLAEFILDQLPGERVVITPKRKVTQWRGLTVVGSPLKFPVIHQAFDTLLEEMESRYERLDKGIEDYPFFNFVVDEYPLIAANCDGLSDTMMMLVRAAREASMRMILTAQGSEGKALNIEGQTSVRECFCRIRLGKMALDHARKLKDDNLYRWLQRQDRPCLVDDQAAIIPDLAGFQPTYSVEVPVLPVPVDAHKADPETSDPEQKVRTLIAQGKSKTDIIWEVWHCKPGRGKDYAKAKREYDRIVRKMT